MQAEVAGQQSQERRVLGFSWNDDSVARAEGKSADHLVAWHSLGLLLKL